jgi:hypothetical protein
MKNELLTSGGEALGRLKTAEIGQDGALVSLEAELDDLVFQLVAAQRADQLLAASDSAGGVDENASKEPQATGVETILGRLYPIERAIMAAPAGTMVGLGVKARHAAYVMSQYWEDPADKIEWEAQVIRLLIEAICDAAGTPPSFFEGFYGTLRQPASGPCRARG